MAIVVDHEPPVRTAWRAYQHGRRSGRIGRQDKTAVLVVLAACLAFWAAAALGLALIL